MASENRNLEQGFLDEESLGFLLGEEVRGFHSDDFEGSNEEYQIFIDVFYGKNACGAVKRCTDVRIINGVSDQNSQSRALVSLNSEGSTLTCQSSWKDLCGGERMQRFTDTNVDISGSGHHQRNVSGKLEFDACNLNSRQLTVSSEWPSNLQRREQGYCLSDINNKFLLLKSSKDDPSTCMLDLNHMHQPTPNRMVESFSQGIISSCYFPGRDDGTYVPNNIDDTVPSRSIGRNDVTEKMNGYDGGEDIAAIVSQESSESKLLMVYEPNTLTMSGDSKFCDSDVPECSKVLVRELPNRLRLHARQLLLDAGWEIETRTRNDRGRCYSIFKTPGEGVVITSLIKAWRTCGELLAAGGINSTQEENSRQWFQVGGFWHDLADALAYIEKEIQHPQNSLYLLHRWHLLDPFVSVVFIDKKIGALREGKGVRFVKGRSVELCLNENSILEENAGIGFEIQSAKSTSCSVSRNEKCRRQMTACGKTFDACSKLREAEQMERLGPSVSHRNNKVVLSLTSNDEIIAKNHSAYTQQNNVLVEGSNEKLLESEVDLRNSASLSLENQMSDRSAAGQKVNFLYTQKESLCFDIDKNSVVKQAACGKQIDVVSEVATYQDTHSSVCQRGSVSGVLVFGVDSSAGQSLDFADQWPGCREIPNLPGRNSEEDIYLIPEHLKEEPVDTIEALKSGPEHTSSAVPVNKKASKRSRKISEIAATKSQHQDLKAIPPGEKHEGEISLASDDKMSDNFDFPLCRGGDNILRMETVPWSLMTSEIHEVPNGSATRMLATLESSSAVTEICTIGENPKNHERLRTRSLKINRKCKKRNQPEVKLDSGSLNMDKDQEGVGECQNDKIECHGENVTSSGATSISSLQHTKTKKFPFMGSKSKMPVVVACHNKRSVRSQGENGTIEASLLFEQKSPESQTNQRTANRNNSEAQKGNSRKRWHRDEIDDDDLLITVIIKTKDVSSNSTHSSINAKRFHSKGCRKLKSRKGSCKLLLRSPRKSGTHSISAARTPLAWLLNCGAVSLNAIVHYCSPKNNTVLKDGRITREGILCKCCSKILSVSAFKHHAGYKLSQSSLNLFLESGKSYTLCQLQAWSDEYKARKDGKQVAKVEELDQNDDTCGLCGDGGELICCDNCPSTFHQACMHSQVIPEGSWYCRNCTCKICGDAIVPEVPFDSFIMLECSQCEKKYHDMCLKKMGSSNVRSVSDTWFCGGCCEEVYFGLRSHVGVMNSITDGFSWTILRCNHSDQKVQSAPKIALMAECNSKLAVALTIMEECFLPMVDPRTGINMIPQVLYNWGSNFPRLDYHGFYTIALEKDDKIISVATIRVHGVTVAEMPLIATCSEHRRQGMCRRLMGAIEEMLKSFKVEMLVLSAIPDLIDTWTNGFGFKPINDDEKRKLSAINLMLFPGTSLLRKRLCEAFERKKPEDEKFSSSREDLNHVGDFCHTRPELVTFATASLEQFHCWNSCGSGYANPDLF